MDSVDLYALLEDQDTTSDVRETIPLGPRPVPIPVDIVGARTERNPLGKASDFIGQTLTWLAEQFGTRTARLLRPLPSGGWLVTTHRRDGTLTYPADDSEVAMAWMVALGRQPLTVTRPRVAQRDGSGMRPISAKTYLGLPVICQDELVGVIELAGDLQGDPDQLMHQAQPRIVNFARRLVHDPALDDEEPALSLTARVALDGGMWCLGEVELNADEVRFLAAVNGTTVLDLVREANDFSVDYTFALARALIKRGLLAVVPR
jgi:hypothetical protein